MRIVWNMAWTLRTLAGRAIRGGPRRATVEPRNVTAGALGLRQGGRLDGDEPVLERVVHELGAAGQPDLLLDVGPVRLDCAHAQVELARDLGVRVAERDQAEDLDF